jgi:hypothetical protein
MTYVLVHQKLACILVHQKLAYIFVHQKLLSILVLQKLAYILGHKKLTFCNLQSRAQTHAVLVIGLYELLGNPTT